MGRELICQVIAIKRALRHEEHELNLQELTIDEKFLFADEQELVKKQEELRALHEKQSNTQLKLKRAGQFSLRYAKGSDHHCIFCFVEHDALNKLVQFVPTSLRVLAITYLRCEQCGRELKVEPPI